MKLILPVILMISVLSACSSGTADKKVPELANEMCDCFTKFQQGMSPDAIGLLKKVSASATPQEELASGISKLKPEEAASFADKLSSIGTNSSDVYECLQAFDKRHAKETTKDKKELTEKMLKEMKAKDNCAAGAAVVNLGLQQQPVE